MSSSSYIPAEDAQALVFMLNFVTLIANAPSLYQLSPADAQNLQYVVAQYQLALASATSPASRSPQTVSMKDQTRATAESLIRTYAMSIKMNNGILPADKIALGVRPPSTERQPVPDPDSSPVLNIVGATPGAQTVRYADSMTPGTGKKPFGVTNLQLYVVVSEEPVEDPADASLYGSFTRNPIGVAFAEADNKKVATYFARWATSRGKVGPWSFPVSMTIAA